MREIDYHKLYWEFYNYLWEVESRLPRRFSLLDKLLGKRKEIEFSGQLLLSLIDKMQNLPIIEENRHDKN
jgi:hypothetical protein